VKISVSYGMKSQSSFSVKYDMIFHFIDYLLIAKRLLNMKYIIVLLLGLFTLQLSAQESTEPIEVSQTGLSVSLRP